jgi:hypothetical protein
MPEVAKIRRFPYAGMHIVGYSLITIALQIIEFIGQERATARTGGSFIPELNRRQTWQTPMRRG